MKKISLLILSIVMLLPVYSFSVLANQNESPQLIQNTEAQEKHNQQVQLKKEKVLSLLSQLNQYRTEKLLKNELQSNKSENKEDSYELNLESQLHALGVTELTQNEVISIQSNSEVVMPNIVTPPTTSSVKWYSWYFSYYSNGIYYDVQELYAQGLNGNSNLSNGQDGAVLYTNKEIFVQDVIYIGKIYAQKVIGLIPVVSWLPYELLFEDNSNVVNNSHVVTYRSLSTVSFSYVKLNGQSDDYQELTYISNMFDLASSNTLAGYNNGVSYSKTTDKYVTVYANNYASISAAVASYNDGYGGSLQSFVSFFRFYNHDNSASITDYLLTPISPLQIY